ncbi:hypothetical protein DFH07DRAFT_389597 [Mycena maculata]|uniref:SWIM-type domain-containing protein n=1 Tax=Mycena maculata TaxID=230809 RepID=A0AAD7KAY5_9AGAR|nr:hypothetical protein DFH07DRAFT_389597 [Mycena maculata]
MTTFSLSPAIKQEKMTPQRQRPQLHISIPTTEGPDIEVKKRQDIIKRSKVYVKDDILELEDSEYLVPSKSNSSKIYEVDVDAYTCSCLDFPLISYCKHISAVQNLFHEPGAPSDGVPRPSPQIPIQDNSPILLSGSPPPSPKKPRALTNVAEKLERLAARLRRPLKKDICSLPVLEAAVDSMLVETETSNVLPSSKYIPPNKTFDWMTTHAKMMPGVKTKKKPVNPDRDLSYGAGNASGSKAKREKSKAHASSSSQPVPFSTPAPPPPFLPSLPGPPLLPSFPPTFPHPVPPSNSYQGPQHMYSQPTYIPYYPYYYAPVHNQ